MATIAENLQTILDIKSDIKNAIIAKGVSVADSDGFATYASKIESIETGTTSIDVGAMGLKFGYSTFTQFPSIFDFSNVTNMSYMFYGCSYLTNVPLIKTSNATNMIYMFSNCSNLTTVPLFDTSNVTNMESMFQKCSNLTTVPEFDTSNVTTMRNMFYYCSNLTTVPEFNLSAMTGYNYNCTQIFGTSNYVINFGGFKDLGKAYQNSDNQYRDVMLQSQSELSYQSCMNVINKVYNLTLKPDYTNSPKIIFHATPYALLSADDIAIATSKGWSVVSA